MSNTTQLIQQAAQLKSTYPQMLQMLGVSAFLGAILAFGSFFIVRFIDPRIQRSAEDGERRQKAVMSAANLLFFCVGLTGVLMVLDNNLMRAFIIVTTIAIISFRIPVDNKAANSELLFALLIGVSCGVNEVSFASVILGVYLLLNFLLVLSIRYFRKTHPYAMALTQELTGDSDLDSQDGVASTQN